MKVALVVFAAVCMLQVASAMQWEDFKSAYGKKYMTIGEETARRGIFEDNLKKIETHNASGRSFKLGVNKFADMTAEEFGRFYLGARFNSSDLVSEGSSFIPRANVKLPTSVDWRTAGIVTPIKDQGQCGSCWAFSTVGSLEGQHARKTGSLVSLSEQNLVDCSGAYGNYGCNGGLMDNAFTYIKANGGIDTEVSYPYTAQDGTCVFNAANVGATCTGFTDVISGSESDLQNAVATVGPVSVAIDASNYSFQLYASGIYDEPNCSSTSLDHGVLAVGYDTNSQGDYWIVKNSWGTSWGQQGYIWMSRNKSNQCGIATSASYPLV